MSEEMSKFFMASQPWMSQEVNSDRSDGKVCEFSGIFS